MKRNPNDRVPKQKSEEVQSKCVRKGKSTAEFMQQD